MSKDSIIRFCSHCSNTTPQKIEFVHEYKGLVYNTSDGKQGDMDFDCKYFVCVCQTCNEVLLYNRFDDNDLELVYPEFELDDSVPSVVKKCYMEAVSIRVKAPNAYAVMIRRSLEAICDDRQTKKGDLYSRLKELSERGEIPSVIIELTDVLRKLGNAGAHNTNQDITVPMTWNIDKFFKAVIEYVYVAPSKLVKFKNVIK